ncbi:MAG: isoprenyl transferase [Candidatus Stahlbacteria bacterium]|nr:MAG: isoprenyl transferase [Candidatus Stahlbacteria bacterium]
MPKGRLPRHVAIIMDGNGRWARRKMLPRAAGHYEGVKRVREIVRACGEFGISYLTLYTFSAENWDRPQSEVKELMKMLERLLRGEVEELNKNNVRFEAIGRTEALPSKVQDGIRKMHERLSRNTGLVLVLGLNYGGRQEIVDMAKRAAQAAAEGKLGVDSIDEETLGSFQYLPWLPDPDLLIRTGAEKRISNFLLWQSAYTELYFTDVLWPDFKREKLEAALADYVGRERRFGRVNE